MLSSVFDNKDSMADIACRFDYRTDNRQIISAGSLFHLDPNGLLARNKWIDESERLGYALLRVEGSPGDQPIGKATFERAAVLRRWIELPQSPRIPLNGEGLLILQHPLGTPLKLAISEKGVIGASSDRTRIFHTVDTEPGSSGSPCFTTDFDLVAMPIGRSR